MPNKYKIPEMECPYCGEICYLMMKEKEKYLLNRQVRKFARLSMNKAEKAQGYFMEGYQSHSETCEFWPKEKEHGEHNFNKRSGEDTKGVRENPETVG